MIDTVKLVLQVLGHPFEWCSSRANRARLGGARVEVIACLLCRRPELAILLAQSAFDGAWMPPQEGVNLGENFQEAVRRCLAVECCLDLPADEREFSRKIHIRSIRYVGEIPLAKERHGERPVADDAIGTWLEHVVLKRKAYWIATMLIANQSDLTPCPDGKEIVAVRWLRVNEARALIRETNQYDKTNLLIRVLDTCERDLLGKHAPQGG